MKKLILAAAALLSAAALQAQVVLTDFSVAPDPSFATGTWSTATVSTVGGVFTIGTGADNSGTQYIDVSSLNLASASNLLSLAVTARIDSGNAATQFTVNLFDSNLNGIVSAVFNSSSFNTSGFTTATSALGLYQGAISANVPVAYAQIAGGGNTAAFRFSFDSLVANTPAPVPEPSTYAAILGAGALAFVAYRRRQKALIA